MGALYDYFDEHYIKDIIQKASAGQKDPEIPLEVKEGYLDLEIAARKTEIACLKVVGVQQ